MTSQHTCFVVIAMALGVAACSEPKPFYPVAYLQAHPEKLTQLARQSRQDPATVNQHICVVVEEARQRVRGVNPQAMHATSRWMNHE